MREPSPSHKAECEYDAPDRPVCKHADPHRDRSEAMDAAEINAQRHPERPHTDAGENHRKPHIPGSPHSICRNKCERPDDRLYHRDPSDHVETHLRTLRLHAAQNRDRFRRQKYERTACDDDNLRHCRQFFDIIDRLILAPRAETLSDHRHHADSDTDRRDAV